MDKIKLKILGISSGNVASSYTLILDEVNGSRKLPIVIGVLEAQAIAIELEKIQPLRPMTHDLFKNFAKEFKIEVKEVIINRLSEGIFYSYIVATDGNTEKFIDSRTSDAIAIALRFDAAIYTFEEVMHEASISFSESEKEPGVDELLENDEDFENEDIQDEEPEDLLVRKHHDLNSYSLKDLQTMLEKAIKDEDYVFAAKIRDTIKRKEESNPS